MAHDLKLATAVRNAMMNAITTYAGAGAVVKIYDGDKPETPGEAIDGQELLAELVCGDPFATGAEGGVLTLSAISNDASANEDGEASWFRLYKADETTVVMDGTVGVSGADMNINSTDIRQGAAVAITSAVFTAGNA